MSENDMPRELDALSAQFDKAGKTVLPSSLSSDSLFARMDAGELPQETVPPTGKVLHGPWRRYGTLAAALLVVVGLYAAGRSGLLGKENSFDAKSTDSAAPTAMPELATGNGMPDNNYSCAGMPDEKNDAAMLPEENGEEGAAISDSIDFALTPDGIAAAKPILLRQTWEPRGGTEALAYLFTIDGSDYGFDPQAYLLVNYSADTMAFLNDADCEALAALCP